MVEPRWPGRHVNFGKRLGSRLEKSGGQAFRIKAERDQGASCAPGWKSEVGS